MQLTVGSAVRPVRHGLSGLRRWRHVVRRGLRAEGLLGQGRGVVGRRGLPGGRRVRGLRPALRRVVQLRRLLVHRRRGLREVRPRRRRGLRRRHLDLQKARTGRDSRLQWPSTWLWLCLLVPCGEGCMKEGGE